MAEQITLTNLVNLQNETTAVNAINANNATITDAFLDVLSLSGTAPNQMQSNLDMNSNRIINLPAPVNATDAARFGDITGQLSNTFRTRLSSNVTYYVATTGNDSNPGTETQPFLTPQAAWNVITYTLDLNGYSVIVQMADGTYSSSTFVLKMGEGPTGVFNAGSIAFQGNATDNTKVVFSGATGAINVGVNGKGSAAVTFRNMTLQSTNGHALQAAGALVVINNLNFGPCPGSSACHIYGYHDAFITTEGSANYTVSGNAFTHILAQTGACVALHAGTVTYLNSPVFTVNLVAQYTGQIFYGGITFVNSGTVTGIKYIAETLGYIDVNGQGISYVPGSVAGVVESGGQYDTIQTPEAPMGALAFTLPSANFNTTADQAINISLPTGFGHYRIQAIVISNPSVSMTTAQGGFYTGTSKSGVTVVANTQVYTGLTTNTPGANGSSMAALPASTSVFFNSSTLYLSLTTPQGSAATADVTVIIQPLA